MATYAPEGSTTAQAVDAIYSQQKQKRCSAMLQAPMELTNHHPAVAWGL